MRNSLDDNMINIKIKKKANDLKRILIKNIHLH